MTRGISLLIACVMMIVVSACSPNKPDRVDTNRVAGYLSGLSTLNAGDPVKDTSTLVDLSLSVLYVPKNAVTYGPDWARKSNRFEKYYDLFGSGGTVSLYENETQVNKTSYTYLVKTTKQVYQAADKLIGIYGKPDSVTLNSIDSTQDQVILAADKGNDPDLRYCYEWTLKQDNHKYYIYLAYYYKSGLNFTYLVVCDPAVATTAAGIGIP